MEADVRKHLNSLLWALKEVIKLSIEFRHYIVTWSFNTPLFVFCAFSPKKVTGDFPPLPSH